MSVHYFWTLVIFAVFIAVGYFRVGRKTTVRQRVALAIAFSALWPVLEGGFELEREVARYERGKVEIGTVVQKLSSTGEAGSRTIGRSTSYRRGTTPFINTADGFRAYNLLGRRLLTGTHRAWVVDYRYACGAAAGCSGRDFVTRELWTRLRAGQAINVRSVRGRVGSGRLSENRTWPVAAVNLAIGASLGLVAWLLFGGVKIRRTYVTAPAVITAVESLAAGDSLRWRVRFAYFTADGRAVESADEVYVPGIKTGDEWIVAYPPDQPQLGTLQAPA